MLSSGPFFRDDTIFGVCEALGEDFGFNPNILRALMGAGLLFSPVMAASFYAGGAALVVVSRWLVPDLAEVPMTAGESGRQPIDQPEEAPELPLAA